MLKRSARSKKRGAYERQTAEAIFSTNKDECAPTGSFEVVILLRFRPKFGSRT